MCPTIEVNGCNLSFDGQANVNPGEGRSIIFEVPGDIVAPVEALITRAFGSNPGLVVVSVFPDEKQGGVNNMVSKKSPREYRGGFVDAKLINVVAIVENR